MSVYECLSCRGVYQDPQPDGSSYYHRCPPLSTDPRGGAVERPDMRDETLVFGNEGEASRLKAPGRGRAPYVPPPPPAPEVPRTFLSRVCDFVLRRKAGSEEVSNGESSQAQ